jgi:hypothetical protein
LVDDVEAHAASLFVNVGVEDAVDEAYGGGFVGVGLWEFYVYFPDTAFVRT